MPFTAAHMPSSRTPKNTLRPAGSSAKCGLDLEDRLGRSRQIRGSAEQLRHFVGDRVHHLLARIARGNGLLRPEAGNRFLPSRLQRARLRPLKLRRQLGKRGLVSGKELVPLRLVRRAALHRLAPVGQRIFGHIESSGPRGIRRTSWSPPHPPRSWLRRAPCLFPPAGCRSRSPCARRSATACRSDGLRRCNRLFDAVQIVAVHHPLHMPAVGVEALVHILGKAPVRGPVERDQIVVIKHDQLAQTSAFPPARPPRATGPPSDRRRRTARTCDDPPR